MVSRNTKKRSYQNMTLTFILRGNLKNIEEIKIPQWLLEGRAKQDKKNAAIWATIDCTTFLKPSRNKKGR